MKKSDFKLIGYIGMALGLLSMLGAIFASLYRVFVQGWLLSYWYYPYEKYSLPLWVVGFVLLAIGAGFEWRAYQEE